MEIRIIGEEFIYGASRADLSDDHADRDAAEACQFAAAHLAQVVAIDGNFVVRLPSGQTSQVYWIFAPVGAYSAADLVTA